MTTRERLAAGEFENKMPYPTAESDPDWRVNREKYRIAEGECNERLRMSLAEDHGLAAHPKEPLLWGLAWDHGHSSGYYSDVVYWYETLAELVK